MSLKSYATARGYSTASAMCEDHGLYVPLVYARLRKGWSIEAALSTPVVSRKARTANLKVQQALDKLGFQSSTEARTYYGITYNQYRVRLLQSDLTGEQIIGAEPMPPLHRGTLVYSWGLQQWLVKNGYRSLADAGRKLRINRVHYKVNTYGWREVFGVDQKRSSV
jgi:hypothetical protein